MNRHLSAEEISGFLAGLGTPEEERHARECAGCREAIAAREQSVARFRNAVKEWSEGQGGLARPMARPFRQRGYAVLLRPAAAAMLAVLAAAPIYLSRRHAAERERQDEALLRQVQTEISRSVPEPMEPLTQLVSWASDSTNK